MGNLRSAIWLSVSARYWDGQRAIDALIGAKVVREIRSTKCSWISAVTDHPDVPGTRQLEDSRVTVS
jgi:hypothetical protein